MHVHKNVYFDYFFFISTSIFLALGSIGIYREAFLYLAMANGVTALGYKLIQNSRIEIPKNFYLYFVFILTLFLHTILLNGNLYFCWLFASGLIQWLVGYNFKEIFSKYFMYALTILGLLMGSLYFYSTVYPIEIPNLVSLFAPATETFKHSNIGDLWAVILIGLFYNYTKRPSKAYIPLFLFGAYFLTVSYSRTAVLSLLLGILFIYFKTKREAFFKKYLSYILLFCCLVFVYISSSKTLVYSRPFFFDAIAGLYKYPLGTGLGNFGLVSLKTNLAHNIIFEIVSAMGLFSVFFVYWFTNLIREFLKKSSNNVEYASMLLVIFVTFLFNTTYTIPSFVWIVFLVLCFL